MRRLLPAFSLLLCASALLILRHSPAIASHWSAWLAAPRLVVGAWALWVAMRGRKDEGPRANPEPFPVPPLSDERSDGPPVVATAGDDLREPTPSPCSPQPLPPSVLIGIVLSLSAAASVVGGLWLDWRGVRILSAAGWAVAAWIGRRAR